MGNSQFKHVTTPGQCDSKQQAIQCAYQSTNQCVDCLHGWPFQTIFVYGQTMSDACIEGAEEDATLTSSVFLYLARMPFSLNSSSTSCSFFGESAKVVSYGEELLENTAGRKILHRSRKLWCNNGVCPLSFKEMNIKLSSLQWQTVLSEPVQCSPGANQSIHALMATARASHLF